MDIAARRVEIEPRVERNREFEPKVHMTRKFSSRPLARRAFLQQGATAFGALALGRFVTGCASRPTVPARSALVQVSGRVIDLNIAETQLAVAGRSALATTVNGGIPGPEIRLREGEDITLRVHNQMDETSSIHWHGLLVPPGMDGVPGISFDGIPAGKTFEYRFKLRQSGTYWYHSHSGFQEQTGIYGALVIDAKGKPSAEYDREYTIVLSDWTFENPTRVFRNLKAYGGYYNFQRRTLANLSEEAAKMGLLGALKDRMSWGRMRMDSTDIADVTGVTYTYLLNGLSPDENWRGLFKAGERVRLRFVNASAATYFDVRIPGLPVQVIEADGQPVKPVEVDEFRIATAETLDVIVQPTKAAYTIFAETMDRSGYARGTLSLDRKATAAVPQRRRRALLTMDDMGMDHGSMDMSGGAMKVSAGGMDHAAMGHGSMKMDEKPKAPEATSACAAGVAVVGRHNKDDHGAGNSMVAQIARSRVAEPGLGLRDAKHRVLTYADLQRAQQVSTPPPPSREILLHLTGNMERYMWSFNGEQYHSGMPPIVLKRGERVRFVLLNDTMMSHPIHLHGMFFELEVGACGANPLKHTVNVKPAERTSFLVTAEEVGKWAFHCHILYHMAGGMFRVVEVRP